MPNNPEILDLLYEKPSNGRHCVFKARSTKRQVRPNLVYKNVVGLQWEDSTFRYINESNGLVQRSDLMPPHRALEAAGPVPLASFVLPYSLDKCRRWETLRKFRDGIESLQDPSIGLTVSGLELYMSPFKEYEAPSLNNDVRNGSRRKKSMATAYHSVDKAGNPVHRFAQQLTATSSSLIDKAMPPRNKRRRRIRHQQQQVGVEQAEQLENEAAINTDGKRKNTKGDWQRPAHVRYVFLTEHPSRHLNDMKPMNPYRKLSNGRTSFDAFGNNEENDEQMDELIKKDQFMRKKERDMQRDILKAVDEYFDECEEKVTLPTGHQYYAPQEFPAISARLENFVVAKKVKQPKNKKSFKLPFDEAYDRWLLRQASVEAASSSEYASDVDHDAEPLVQQPIRVREPVLPMRPIEILLPEQDIEPQALKAAYKDAYFECATLPRRFILNVSDTVRSVMNISHGANAVLTKNVQVFVVFEVQIATKDDLKKMMHYDSDDDDEVGPMARIRVWLNISHHNDAGVFVSLEKCYDDEMNLNEFLKAIVIYIGTLPIDAFECKAQENFPLCIQKPSIVIELLPQRLLSKTSCLRNGQVATTALLESNMVRKVQRQITIVAAYYTNSCNWFVNAYQECSVCFADDFDLEGMALASCGHFFCSQCWTDHAVEALDAGLVPIKCMEHDCDATIDYDTAISLLPLAHCERYANQLSERHVLSHSKNWRYCRNDRCDRIIHILGQGHVGVVACDCGETFCGQCGNAVHFPASCKHAEKYINALIESGDHKAYNNNEKRVDVKRCPTCSTPMEKHSGCNQMTCRCGSQFCWGCNQIWTGGRHYACAAMDGGFETIVLRDVMVKNKTGMSYIIYDQCAALRRLTFAPNILRIRKGCAELGIGKQSTEDYIRFYIEMTHLLEFTIAFSYFASLARTKKERRARRPQMQGVHSVANRVSFLLKRWQQALDAGQKDSIEPTLHRAKIISGDLARMAACYSIGL